MHTVAQALADILREIQPPEPTLQPLSEALGMVLAEEILSDVDSPPFDKALMDGFAVRAEDVAQRTAELKLVEEVTAGQVPSHRVGPGEAIRIMTGAPMPDGADAVVKVEDAQIDEASGLVRMSADSIQPGANMMHRGTSLKRGERVLPAGRLLRPQELGALAELGRAEVLLRRRPRVAVLATGDELVPIDEQPGPGQIRNSNETMLVAQIRRAGGEPVPLGIARDDRSHLRERIEAGLACDVLLLSGGVSAGKLDLAPSELEAAGVQKVFHKVRVKPGKPLWFGVWDRARRGSPDLAEAGPEASHQSGETFGQVEWHVRETVPQRRRRGPCYVFGLPGNPVSSMVCFELFVRSAIRRLMGVDPPEPQPVSARLTQEHLATGDRPTYHPARLEWTDAGPIVEPVRWRGSSDLRATVDANAMALFPAGEKQYRPGERVEVFSW